jgi:FlaA1/EpsC-like NDP-sugar epimerase
MYEELFKDSEEFAETYHPRILRAKKSAQTNGHFQELLTELQQAAIEHNNDIIPFILRKMVPEFQPNVTLSKAAFIPDTTNSSLEERKPLKISNGSSLLNKAETN